MSDKCNKYESLFVFGDEKSLQEHLNICEDCRIEHEKMNKTANLVKETKPYYENLPQKKPNNNLIKLAAGLMVLFLAYFSVSNVVLNNKIDETIISSSESESVIAEMGLPTDEYGLLMVY